MSNSVGTVLLFIASLSSMGGSVNETPYYSELKNTQPIYEIFQNNSSSDTFDERLDIESSSTYYISIENFAVKENLDPLINELINNINEENIEEDYCPAIEFINEQDNLDHDRCVNIICQAFKLDNYCYSKKILSTVMRSDINYLSPWFKSLILESKTLEHLSSYANDIYDLYDEAFDKL